MWWGAVVALFPQATPGPLAATAAAYPAAPGKVGREPPGRSGGAWARAGGEGRRRCPGRRASSLRAGAGAEERRNGGGVGGAPLSSSAPTCSLASNSVLVVTGCGEDACAFWAFGRGSRLGSGSGPGRRCAPSEGPILGR